MPPLTIDRHTLAMISIVGCSLDVLGALYLAYDLLGGEHGPLRTLTRAVTYGALFGAGYGVFLGPFFGLVGALAHGTTLAWEYSRAARQQPNLSVQGVLAVSAIRGLGYAVGTGWLFGPTFGILFGLLSTAGQTLAYRLGISPTTEYNPATRPRLTRFQLLTAVNRTLGYMAAGYVCSLAIHHREEAVAVGIKAGLMIGIVTVIIGTCTPFVEWSADHVPEKRMGVVGIGLILVGFTMQSVQYWVTLLDVTLR